MSEFLNDPFYHQRTTNERPSAVEHIANAGGIVVDVVTVAFQGLADVARRVTHRQGLN